MTTDRLMSLYLFKRYKDKPITNVDLFRYKIIVKHKYCDIPEINKIYISIINYQIKKYGCVLYDRYFKLERGLKR